MADSIPARMLKQAETRPNDPAYFVRSGGSWKSTSWADYAGETQRVGRALIALGVQPGDCTSILGFNKPEWVMFDVATMGVGGSPAGIYTTCSPEEVRYVAQHCAAKVVLVESVAQWEKINQERANLPDLQFVVTMKGVPAVADDMVLTWDEFLAKGDDTSDQDYLDRVAAIDPNALATLIYTSGTTGPPKGVMLSHSNLTWTADTAARIVGLTSEDTVLSYLPLSHIAEQMFSIHGPITAGTRVNFAESIDKVPDNLKEVQPTVFFGVPRIWEKFHAGISTKMKGATGIKAKLVKWAMKVGMKNTIAKMNHESHGGFSYNWANKLIFSKLKPAVGLGNARICVSGAAPIAKEVLEFFASLDLVVLEVYGQSEDCGPTTFNQPDQFRYGTVGPRIDGVEVKIADDGEICVKGPNVFMGYYKDEDATARTLIDGWLHSGDLGSFDSDGFLSITGRKKDIIITAGGKNIAPKNIEAALKNHELINEAVVIGDRRKYLSALVTLDPDALDRWCEANSVSAADAPTNEKMQAHIQECVDEVNTHFARVEQIKKFTVLKRNLTVEDGELTPTLKVKRNKVNEHFADQIESMY